jgi:hypothetical protein
MQEKRKHARKHIGCAFKVSDINRKQLIGCMVDLSEDGFMLLTDQIHGAGAVLQLRVDFPSEVNGVSHIELGAESLWAGAANKANHFWAGFRIIDLSDSAAATLAVVISKSLSTNLG